MTDAGVEFSEHLAKPAYTPPPTFKRIDNAEVALAKITKIEVRHFEFLEHSKLGRYASSGSVTIHILHREETLSEFGDRGYKLLQFFLDLYGIDDPTEKYQPNGIIYP